MDNRINGVKIISANENISEGSKSIILEYVLEGMAEYYSADLRLIRESYSWINIKCKFNGDPITFGFNFEPAAILGTFVFRGFFMPEYCFLRRYSGRASAFFAKFLLYYSRCTRSELLCRCHSFRLKSQDFSGLCSRRYIRAFPTICRCQRQTIPHRLRRKIQAYRIWKSLCSTAFATLFSKTCFRADEIVPLGLQLNLKIV